MIYYNIINNTISVLIKSKVIITMIMMIMSSSILFAQESYVQLAFEYYNKGEYEKAVEYFKELSKEDNNYPVIYERYLASLVELNDDKSAKQLIRKMRRKFPDNIQYEVDEIFLKRDFGRTAEFEKELQDFIDDYTKSNVNLRPVSNILMRKREYQWAEKLYLTARENNRNDFAYVQELLTIYRASGNEDGVFKESLNLIKSNPQNINYAENILQSFINQNNYEKLERELIKLMQKDSKGVFNSMLIWTYIQVKQFENAFIQAKALDRRFNLMGEDLINLGKICFENQAFETAIEIYTYVVEKYPKGDFYPIAKQKLIETREEVIKNTYPVRIEHIKVLIRDYKELITELGLRRNTAEAMRKMALLYAFYLNEHDSAIYILQEAINAPRTGRNFIGLCKLNMGDIYLLKNEAWESVLLYSQVDKSYKEQTIGHEAKLSLAKLYFYQGDFELAQENLDILKLATSREIANDAMDLSLLIQDNLALDTSGDALAEFAKIDLLKFQKQYTLAIESYQQLLEDFPNHSLSDEVYWNLSFVFIKLGMFSEALDNLNLIITKYSDDIYGDDALFTKGDLLENKMDRKEEAMEVYKKILFEYPGSIYNVEARKRFRKLRGDYQ